MAETVFCDGRLDVEAVGEFVLLREKKRVRKRIIEPRSSSSEEAEGRASCQVSATPNVLSCTQGERDVPTSADIQEHSLILTPATLTYSRLCSALPTTSSPSALPPDLRRSLSTPQAGSTRPRG